MPTADPKELLGKGWKLKELNGTKVVIDSYAGNQPYIKFDDLKKASGNLGCNDFGAKVQFTGKNSVKISEIMSTKIACESMQTETQFSEALKKHLHTSLHEQRFI